MTETVIELSDLTKIYNQQYAVDHLSLSIKKGEIFGLLGPNGAGKSTTILMILGLSEPTSGSVHVKGIDSTRQPIDVKKIVGYLPDDLGFYDQMTGLENLLYTAALNAMPIEEAESRALYLLKQVGLIEAKDQKTNTYSRGMRQRLGLADVLMKKPEIIILDEPTLGIDPEGVRDLLKLIKQLSVQENITILLSSHHLHQVQQICDRVGIFVKGKLLAQGNIAELAQQLFTDDVYIVDLEFLADSKMIIDQLKQIKGVHKIEQITDGKLRVYCEQDLTAAIASTVFESGGQLIHLSHKDYGLDEIYHRYFEGGGKNESA